MCPLEILQRLLSEARLQCFVGDLGRILLRFAICFEGGTLCGQCSLTFWVFTVRAQFCGDGGLLGRLHVEGFPNLAGGVYLFLRRWATLRPTMGR